MRQALLFTFLVLPALGPTAALADPPQPVGLDHLFADERLQQLGEKIFLDENLSQPKGQSCATCHGPAVGWSGPDEAVNQVGGVYEGAVQGRFGNRKPTSVAYSTYSPPLQLTAEGFVGGNFWDGRASGWHLGNPAADQAQGPFLNPLEQNLPDARQVVLRICGGSYGQEFKAAARELWREQAICLPAKTELAFAIAALAIAAFEHSPQVSPFSSKYDAFLAGKVKLSAEEKRGLDLFGAKARCAGCHPSHQGPAGQPPLFTDFTYDNLGLPANPDNPFYGLARQFNPKGKAWLDQGLAETLMGLPAFAMLADQNRGRHRVPTLRNVDRRPQPDFVKAFGHNGYFKSLLDFVHFYNTRDVLPSCAAIASRPRPGRNCWPAPEIPENLNKEELGDLKLSPEEERALVAFLKTLSDGYLAD